MRDDDGVFATLKIRRIDKAEPDIRIVSDDICTVTWAIHPSLIDRKTRVKSIREVFASCQIVVPGCFEEIPWLRTVWCDMCPIVVIGHVLGFGLG